MDSNLVDSVAAYGNCLFKMDGEIEIDWKFPIGRDEDIQWVRKATDEDAGAAGRINEIIYGRTPCHIVGFKVEALTGIDAKQLKSRNDYEGSK